MARLRAVAIWGALGLALAVPLVLAAGSPLIAWRQPVYILAGFAGIAGLGLIALQPLLVRGVLPGLRGVAGRRAHRWVGLGLGLAVVVHVGGLWLTSPPDVIDALLLRSPTPFAIWGVLAMWSVFATALLAGLWRRLRLHPRLWRRAHLGLGALIAGGTIAHALLILGTMEPVSKWALCLLAGAAVIWAILAELRRG